MLAAISRSLHHVASVLFTAKASTTQQQSALVIVNDRLICLSNSLQYKRTQQVLKRKYGLGLSQMAAISMKAARSACHLGDPDSVVGIVMCGAFSLGMLMGGRRL